jgi:hypothetical protein
MSGMNAFWSAPTELPSAAYGLRRNRAANENPAQASELLRRRLA